MTQILWSYLPSHNLHDALQYVAMSLRYFSLLQNPLLAHLGHTSLFGAVSAHAIEAEKCQID